MMVFNSSYVV